MIKTSKQKTQAKTVVHEGKVYKGVMPNLNMKTDLTGSFEYIATIVEGMSSGNQNGNPIYDDFKQKIIEHTISGEVGKLINERGHVPENYDACINKVSISTDMPKLSKPNPLPNFPAEVGKASDVLVNKMVAKNKEVGECSIPIDLDHCPKNSKVLAMGELMELIDEWEKDNPFTLRPNESSKKRLERIEEELKSISKKASVMKACKIAEECKGSKKKKKSLMHSMATEPMNEEERMLKRKYEATNKKKKAVKKKTKKKSVKKTKKKVAKRRSAKKD